MSESQIPAIASVAPRSKARSATGTSSPAGANRIAPSSGSGGASVAAPMESTPRTGEFLVVLAAGENVYPLAHVQRDLRGDVGAATEAVNTQPTADGHVGGSPGPVADDPGAQQRRCMLVVHGHRQPVGESFIDDTEVGVATVAIPAGEGRRAAQILRTPPAIRTGAVNRAQPRHADPFTDRERTRVRTQGFDASNDLVSRGDPGPAGRQVALGEMQVGAAHATARDPDEDVGRSRLGPIALDPAERPFIDRPRSVDYPGLHQHAP